MSWLFHLVFIWLTKNICIKSLGLKGGLINPLAMGRVKYPHFTHIAVSLPSSLSYLPPHFTAYSHTSLCTLLRYSLLRNENHNHIITHRNTLHSHINYKFLSLSNHKYLTEASRPTSQTPVYSFQENIHTPPPNLTPLRRSV